MSGERLSAMIRVFLMLLISICGFLLSGTWIREQETSIVLLVLHMAGAGQTYHGEGTSIAVAHGSGGPFVAVLTPACSSWPSVLALISLALVVPRVSMGRRLALAISAGMFVFIGNIVRIAASVAVGLWVGPASLVLFHNFVGSMFGFAYTFAGFVWMIILLMPPRGIPLDQPYREGGGESAYVSGAF